MADYRRERQSYESRSGGDDRGRPRLRWEDCVLKERCEEGRRGGRLEEEDRRQRRALLADEAVKKLQAAPHGSPLTKGKRGRERCVPSPSKRSMSTKQGDICSGLSYLLRFT